jgi:phage-related minor tail protein
MQLAGYLAPAMEKIAEVLGKVAGWLSQLSPEVLTVIGIIAGVVAALAPVLIVVGKIAFAISSIMSLMSTIGPVIAGISGPIMSLMSTIGPVIAGISGPIGIAIAAIGALVAAGVWLYKNWDKVKAFAGSLKDKLVAVWNEIKTTAISAIDKVKGAFTSLKDTLSNVFNTIKAVASAAWAGIKFAITHPIDAAVLAVRLAIQKIKEFFSGLNLKLPHIKLPHFKVSGKLSLAPPSVPKLSIDWYKNGAIFKQPTIFPNGMNGIGVGDVSGGEAVLPLKELWRQLDKRYRSGITINVYGSDNMSVSELAAEVERRLIASTNRKRQAWT